MNAKELKIGNIVEMDGKVYTCVSLQHIQQPRLAPFIKVQMKELKTGALLETNLKVTDKLNEATREVKQMQYLYDEGDLLYFMDPESFDQFPVNKKDHKNAMRFNTEGALYDFTYVNGEIINVAPQTFITQEVVECDAAVAGDTARNAMKEAKLESGATIKVPMFIKTGDKIEVDTRTDEYVKRVN
ncbi:MAG: elongation factor P [Firmicutes bacterium]|nr:elongation factor P [Bacillota bacterium]